MELDLIVKSLGPAASAILTVVIFLLRTYKANMEEIKKDVDSLALSLQKLEYTKVGREELESLIEKSIQKAFDTLEDKAKMRDDMLREKLQSIEDTLKRER